MLRRETLVAEHTELSALAAQLSAATRADAPDDGIAALRWRMTRLLAVHLACEDRLLYPALRGGDDPRAASLAERLSAEVGGLAAAWRAYCADWPGERIAGEWARFGRETAAILATLADRIAREERDLYPVVPWPEDGRARGASRLGSRGWATPSPIG